MCSVRRTVSSFCGPPAFDYNILKEYTSLKLQGYNIVFCWIPSHIGIHGNTKADSAAKQALQLPITDFKIPYTDLKALIREYVKHLWQIDWNENVNNKLHKINPIISKTQSVILKRRDEVVITRCRIGHSRITHSFLLQREDPPECVFCQCPLINSQTYFNRMGRYSTNKN